MAHLFRRRSASHVDRKTLNAPLSGLSKRHDRDMSAVVGRLEDFHDAEEVAPTLPAVGPARHSGNPDTAQPTIPPQGPAPARGANLAGPCRPVVQAHWRLAYPTHLQLAVAAACVRVHQRARMCSFDTFWFVYPLRLDRPSTSAGKYLRQERFAECSEAERGGRLVGVAACVKHAWVGSLNITRVPSSHLT